MFSSITIINLTMLVTGFKNKDASVTLELLLFVFL